MPDTIKVKILVMERHFLYLPLYLAQFDHPKSGKLPFFGKIPRKYSVEVRVPEQEDDRTDAGVFRMLIEARLASSDIMFAVCDPFALLGRPDERAFMAASLISSSAFWAVNHDARDVRLVSELSSFDRIICYKSKTTSNLIARRIVKEDKNKLKIVQPTDEIRVLEELGEGSLAISPEVLKIANLVHGPLKPGEKRADIVLDLCTTKEFSNVLTSALFTREEVVEKHPELVFGVLISLQKALLAIHASNPMVVECARFNYQDAFQLDEALEIAKNGNVFPETIHVRHDRWQRACEFYYISHALAEGKNKRELTRAELLKTEQIYRQAVQDRRLQKLVSEAISCGFSEGFGSGNGDERSAKTKRWLPRLEITWACALLAIGFGAGHVFSGIVDTAVKIAMSTSWVLMLLTGWWSGELACYRKPSSGYAAHWVAFTLLWWALHELVVPCIVQDAHFLIGVALHDALAGGILTLTGTWVIGVGTVVRFRKNRSVNKGRGV